MDESRKQFDEAYERMQYDHFGSNRDFAWKFWVASREAIEVELPAWFVSDAIAVYDRDEVEESIRAAGIKVKE